MTEQHETTDALKTKLSLAIEERNCAMEMWELAKQVAEQSKSQVPEDVRREIDCMKMEYSEAINLLEAKCANLERLLQNSAQENQKLTRKLAELSVKIRDVERESGNKDALLKAAERERESLRMTLDQTREALKLAEQVSLQARDKVADALSMAQDALANEASIAEEKAQLEEELSNQISAFESRITQDVEKVRADLSAQVDQLSQELHTVTLERNQMHHEIESSKADRRIVEKRLTTTNANLARELDDTRAKRLREASAWYEQRDSLTRQVNLLQKEIEKLAGELKIARTPCANCDEFKRQVDRYKTLANRWEEAADRVTTDFEKYLHEAKEHHWHGCQNPNSPKKVP
ncbi:Hypothetical protein NTJ_04489 [Nesidiocoris tenuis]|uniref:Uncharacterized protein n=1 Tax=Nesidiocoris tenuis TaxID=355587 RepID=A0ABN7ALA8_9HEMI|nr:Hypothetical protein NTJ_04489 [Nesidiocoris tenuis]